MHKEEYLEKINYLQKLIKEKEDYIDYLEKLTAAHSNVLLLADNERKTADQTIRAYQSLQDLTEQELREKNNLIKANQNIMKITSSELTQKNVILTNILEINQFITTIIQEEVILKKTIENMVNTLNFKRGILFLKEQKELQAKIYFKVNKEEKKKKYFKYCFSIIKKVSESKKGIFVNNKKIVIDNIEKSISFVCVPIYYLESLFGIIYLDIIGKPTSFKEKDLSIAEIFATQAAISVSNVLLYKKLKQQSITDRFTGLPNRKKLEVDLETPGRKLFALLNIDSFSSINIAYGVDAGNHVLRIIAKRLQNILPSNTTLYKLSADEFVILSTNKSLTPNLLKNSIKAALTNNSIKYRDIYINISLSAGVVLNQEKNILRKADMALKAARKKGHGYMVIYDKELNVINKYKETFFWVNRLKKAIRENRMVPYFQGIMNNKSKKIEVYECFARILEDNGVILPKKFLEPAKELGLYSTISYCIIEKCFNYFKDKQIIFSINLSREDFTNIKLLNFISSKIKQFSLNPENIIFEMSEEISIHSDKSVLDFIKELKNIGVKIAIDDFGSEYSNFSRLLSINTDFIKIDGSFIKQIDIDANSYKIVKAITDFAHSIGARVIAEFVHSDSVQKKVLDLGIEYSQGNLFSKCMPNIPAIKK